MKDIPWADLLCCDWCKKSFTSLQVCFLRPDMNICPLAFKKRPQWRAEAVFQREIGCFVNLWHGFWNSIFMRENENKQRDPSYLHGEDLQTDDWPSWISPPTTASSAFVKESTGATRSLFHILSHLIPWKTICFAEMFQQSMDWGNIGFCFRLNHPFLPPQNIHSFMFWNNQHTYLSWFLPSSKGHAVDAFYEEALFPTLGDWKSCCGIRSITGLTLMATEHAGVKFHFSPSLPLTHKWCPLPTPKPQHPPPPLLCSTLCVCCSRDSAESPRCNFLFALSWTETPQRSAERGESALLTGSLPHLSQFLLHLHVLLLLVVLARSRRQVVLLWL